MKWFPYFTNIADIFIGTQAQLLVRPQPGTSGANISTPTRSFPRVTGCPVLVAERSTVNPSHRTYLNKKPDACMSIIQDNLFMFWQQSIAIPSLALRNPIHAGRVFPLAVVKSLASSQIRACSCSLWMLARSPLNSLHLRSGTWKFSYY
jgi:hypothetical protein